MSLNNILNILTFFIFRRLKTTHKFSLKSFSRLLYNQIIQKWKLSLWRGIPIIGDLRVSKTKVFAHN